MFVPKIEYFLFPLTKKWPYPKSFFHDLEIHFFFFIHQNLYLLLRGLFFITLLFFHTILFQNSKLNTVEHLGGNDIFIIFWNSLSFFEDKTKI